MKMPISTNMVMLLITACTLCAVMCCVCAWAAYKEGERNERYRHNYKPRVELSSCELLVANDGKSHRLIEVTPGHELVITDFIDARAVDNED
jgi:hypothetical protein